MRERGGEKAVSLRGRKAFDRQINFLRFGAKLYGVARSKARLQQLYDEI